MCSPLFCRDSFLFIYYCFKFWIQSMKLFNSKEISVYFSCLYTIVIKSPEKKWQKITSKKFDKRYFFNRKILAQVGYSFLYEHDCDCSLFEIVVFIILSIWLICLYKEMFESCWQVFELNIYIFLSLCFLWKVSNLQEDMKPL